MHDRTLPLWLKLPLVVMAAVQIVFGLNLLTDPAAIGELWPWPLAPVTARVLGASTLVSVPLALLSVLSNRWSVARIPIVMLLAYRVIQIAAGLVHLDRFDFTQPVTWNYFGAGTFLMLLFALALGFQSKAGQPTAAPPRWPRQDVLFMPTAPERALLVALAAFYFLLAVTFFVFGSRAEFLWFEPAGRLTALTARLFASPVLGIALGLALVTRVRTWGEVAVPAVGMVTIGLAGSAAFLLELGSITPPTLLGFLLPVTPLVLLIVGVYLLLSRRRVARRAGPHVVPGSAADRGPS